METYGLGTEVVYRDCHGEVQRGVIVGAELLDRDRRDVGPAGLNFFIRTSTSCDVVHHTAVIGPATPPASIFGY